MIAILFGVSGSGKTVLGTKVAEALKWDFIDADDLHSDTNRKKMQSGNPLTDEDRAPWLAKIKDVIDARPKDRNLVLAFSALKKSYRDLVRGSRADILFIYLHASAELIRERLAKRQHAYMPASLLASQFATLEAPTSPCDGIQVSVEETIEEGVENIILVIKSFQERP